MRRVATPLMEATSRYRRAARLTFQPGSNDRDPVKGRLAGPRSPLQEATEIDTRVAASVRPSDVMEKPGQRPILRL